MKRRCFLSICVLQLSANVYAATDDFSDALAAPNNITVISPTRLRQTLADTPAPVTVITRVQMRELGVTSIVEALRYVPGMVVAPASGNEYRVSFHGTNGVSPRRMQVLIDGMSVFRNSVSIVNWETLPIDIEDVERIEVTRAPAGATYGTNSFLSVVNIITRHPESNQDNVIRLATNNQSQQDVYAKYASHTDSMSFWVNVHGKKSTGFDHLNADLLDITQVADGHDDLKQTQLNSRVNVALTDNTSFEMALNLVDKTKGTLQGDTTGAIPSEERGTDIYFRSLMSVTVNDRHEFNLGVNYVVNENNNRTNACYTAFLLIPEMRSLYLSYPAAALTFANGQTPVGNSTAESQLIADVSNAISAMGSNASMLSCGNINIDDKDTRTDLSFSDTYVLSKSLRTILGFNFSQIEFESAYHVNGTITENRYSVFDSLEYKPDDAWTFNMGLLGEIESHYQDSATFWSPRVGANYHINNNNTIRTSWTRAYRTPDYLERESNWQFTLTDLNPAVNSNTSAQLYFSVIGNPALNPERIDKSEIGYLGYIVNKSIMIDASLYREEISNVITSGIAPVFVDQFNAGYVTLKGFDLNTIYNLHANTNINLGYAYQSSDTDIPEEKTLYAKHASFLAITQRFEDDLTMTGGMHTSSNLGGSRATNYDFTLLKQFRLTARTTIDTRFNASYQEANNVVDLVNYNFVFSNDSQLVFRAEASLHY